MADMLLAQTVNDQSPWLIYLIFIFAGILAGGAWSTYKNGVPLLALILGLLATMAALGGILWMIGMING